MIPNTIIDNVFDKNQLFILNDYLTKVKNEVRDDEPQLGRTRLDFKNAPSEIILHLENYAKSFNPNFKFMGAYMSEYNSKYGKPELSIHTDNTSAVFTIDYQLDANVDWRVFVEGEAYQLKNNQALTINVHSQAHWRPQRIFKDGEYVKMIFFHFVDSLEPNKQPLSKAEMDVLREKWDHLWQVWED